MNIKSIKTILVFFAVIIVGVIGYTVYQQKIAQRITTEDVANQFSVTQKIEKVEGDKKPATSYTVTRGETALSLLARTEEGISMKGKGENAFITAIGDRTANEKKKEYWALYINGKPAKVGAGSYILRFGDKIEWKIKTF